MTSTRKACCDWKKKSACILWCTSDLNAAGRPVTLPLLQVMDPLGGPSVPLAPTLARVLYVVLVC